MKIVPLEKLENIPTGNTYKGRDGLIDLQPHQSLFDVTVLFPFHKVTVVSAEFTKNVTSLLFGGQISVHYNANNRIDEIEILTPNKRIPEMNLHELLIGNVNIFGKSLAELKIALEADGCVLRPTDGGVDLSDGSVSFYSHDFEGDLKIKLDTVVLRFT